MTDYSDDSGADSESLSDLLEESSSYDPVENNNIEWSFILLYLTWI